MTDFNSASMQPALEFTKVHVEQVTGTDKYKATGTFEWNGRQVTLTRTFTSDSQAQVTDDVAKAKLNEIKGQMLSVAQKEIFTTGGTISLQRVLGAPDQAPAPARQFALLKTTQDAANEDISERHETELNKMISSIFGQAMDQLRQSGAISPQSRPQDQPPPYELALSAGQEGRSPSPKRKFPRAPAPELSVDTRKLATEAEKAKEQAAAGTGSKKPRAQEDTIKQARIADDAETIREARVAESTANAAAANDGLILQEIPQDERAAVQQQPQALLQQDQPSDTERPVAPKKPAQPQQQQRTEPTAASEALPQAKQERKALAAAGGPEASTARVEEQPRTPAAVSPRMVPEGEMGEITIEVSVSDVRMAQVADTDKKRTEQMAETVTGGVIAGADSRTTPRSPSPQIVEAPRTPTPPSTPSSRSESPGRGFWKGATDLFGNIADRVVKTVSSAFSSQGTSETQAAPQPIQLTNPQFLIDKTASLVVTQKPALKDTYYEVLKQYTDSSETKKAAELVEELKRLSSKESLDETEQDRVVCALSVHFGATLMQGQGQVTMLETIDNYLVEDLLKKVTRHTCSNILDGIKP